MLVITPDLSSPTASHKNSKGTFCTASSLAFLAYQDGRKYICTCANLSLSKTLIPLCRVKSHLRDSTSTLGISENSSFREVGNAVKTCMYTVQHC